MLMGACPNRPNKAQSPPECKRRIGPGPGRGGAGERDRVPMRHGAFRTGALIALLTGATAAPGHAETLLASFINVSDSQFTVQTIGPKDKVLDFTACKGVWFAEKKGARIISFGNPMYGDARNFSVRGLRLKVPEDWTMVTAVVYLKGRSPDGNRLVDVAQQAAICRRSWGWFR
jgi:hypothetical protein